MPAPVTFKTLTPALAAALVLAACGEASISGQGSAQSINVRVDPPAASISAGSSVQVAASVTGTTETAVTWSVQEGAACGSVTASGLYLAGSASGTCHVVATSVADQSRSATSTVTVRACTPAVCRPNVDCGTRGDGCGGTLQCATACLGTATCGGGGTPGICGGGSANDLFLGGFFPVGTFSQPPSEFAAWKALGINTVQGPNGLEVDYWAQGARDLGLKQIRQPIGSSRTTPPAAADYSSMLSDPDFGTGAVLAWAGVMPNSTEWDEIEYTIGPSKSTADYAIATGNALHALDPGTPTFLNSGINGLSDTPSDWPYSGGDYSYQTLFQSIDWVCNDIYPYGGSSYNETAFRGANGGDHVFTAADVAAHPEVAPMLGKGAVAAIGHITDRLRAVLPDKTFLSFVEAGCVTANSPVVPPGGIRAEIWNAIIHGARGVIFFAYSGQLTSYSDEGGGCPAIPEENKAEIKVQTGLVSALSQVLQDVINPTSLGAVPSLPALEAGWRDTPSGKYFFVLNTTNRDQGSATVTLSGVGGATSATVVGEGRTVPVAGGVITDDFPAYALHVYLVE